MPPEPFWKRVVTAARAQDAIEAAKIAAVQLEAASDARALVGALRGLCECVSNGMLEPDHVLVGLGGTALLADWGRMGPKYVLAERLLKSLATRYGE